MEAKKLDLTTNYSKLFSICTFVTQFDEYELMKASYLQNGFNENNSEFLYFDNTINAETVEAYIGIRNFLKKASGKYIIICHQDIEIIDPLNVLQKKLKEIEEIDKNWSLISNAGGYHKFHTCYFISYPNVGLKKRGRLPQRIESADENFLLINSDACLSISNNLKGFHFYGTDLCLISSLLGYSCWAINYNVLHKSKGKHSDKFFNLRKDLVSKYSYFFRSRWIHTPTFPIFISTNFFTKIIKGNKLYFSLMRLLTDYKK